MDLAMRWRVRAGYPLAAVFFWLAHPSAESLWTGTAIAAFGLMIRAAAAGHLRKHEQLSTSGPYAYTRNPLYLGSAFLALGMVVAARSWPAALIIFLYLAVFYPLVMRREEDELRRKYGSAFDEYAAAVPQFIPRVRTRGVSGPTSAQFSWDSYVANREWQASVGVGFVVLMLWVKRIWME
jgi:protein-S-isoprenylcysteine O-methyltransferase Ste14